MTETSAAARKCRFQVGQAVEVDAIAFATPGMPHYWAPAVVEAVTDRDGSLWDVLVRRGDAFDRNGDGLLSAQIVGPRGGNKHIRPAA